MAENPAGRPAEFKVLQVVPTYYPATYWGGPIYSVLGLCNALVAGGAVCLKVLTTDSAGPRLSQSLPAAPLPAYLAVEAGGRSRGYDVYYCHRVLGHSLSWSMLARLWSMVRWSDVVHLTAVYSPPTIPTLLVCRVLGRPVVWSPRGALQRWGGTTRPLVKSIWERLCSALIDRRRLLLHVTSEEEAAESLLRIPGLRTVMVPNGVEIPVRLAPRSWLPVGRVRLLYIGRLHPKKGIENLLQALKLMGERPVSLAICGGGEAAYRGQLARIGGPIGSGRHSGVSWPSGRRGEGARLQRGRYLRCPFVHREFRHGGGRGAGARLAGGRKSWHALGGPGGQRVWALGREYAASLEAGGF